MPSFYARIKAAYVILCRPSIGTSFMTELRRNGTSGGITVGFIKSFTSCFPLISVFM